MEPLLTKIMEAIEQFNTLGRLAPNQLSTSGERDKANGTLHKWQGFWAQLLKKSDDRLKAIKELADGFPDNKTKVSHYLAFYRSLTRYMDQAGSPPTWSAYHEEIRESLLKVLHTIDKLDEKYEMGDIASFYSWIRARCSVQGIEPPTIEELRWLNAIYLDNFEKPGWTWEKALLERRQQQTNQ